jgi:hypothetical protein
LCPYREAFQALGMNPNKYMCSIEALFTRIAQGQGHASHKSPCGSQQRGIAEIYPAHGHAMTWAAQTATWKSVFPRPGDTFLPFGAEN